MMVKRNLTKFFSLLIALILLVGIHQSAAAALGDTIRASIASTGVEGDDRSNSPAISANGRFVAFYSRATNLVAGDTNGTTDVFVHDRQTGETTRVSVDSNGDQGNGQSDHPAISADGRFVAFRSDASNLVAGDTNGYRDIFVHDRQTGATTRVSVNSSDEQGDEDSNTLALSADGRFVAFGSEATNLVPGDTNDWRDVFVHDRQTGETTRVSVTSDGTQGNGASEYPVISADGRFVAFQSYATNLVAGDINGTWDIFIHDRNTGETTRVSVGSAGVEGAGASFLPAISADGRLVTFHSYANNLIAGDTNGHRDIFLHDRQTGDTTRISVDSAGVEADGESFNAAISADGRFVAFQSYATNLVAADTNNTDDIFVHNRQTGATTRVSVASDGSQGDGRSETPSISGNGHFVAFQSDAINLVPSDTNNSTDIFVHDYMAFTYLPMIIH